MQTRTFIFFTGTQASSDGLRLTNPQTVASSQVQGALSFTIPAVLLGARTRAQSQVIATLGGVTATELPCPPFPVIQREQRPARVSDPASGVLIAEAASRIDERHVELDFAELAPSERESVLNAWGNGVGLVRRFQFTVPGEGSARWFVFMEPEVTLEAATATKLRALVTLLDVTRGGE